MIQVSGKQIMWDGRQDVIEGLGVLYNQSVDPTWIPRDIRVPAGKIIFPDVSGRQTGNRARSGTWLL